MKALVKSNSEPGIWMDDVPVPEIEPDEVLIRVCQTSICGTDMHIYKSVSYTHLTLPTKRIV